MRPTDKRVEAIGGGVWRDLVRTAVRAVELELMRGHYQSARSAIDRLERLVLEPEESPTPATHVGALRWLSERTANSLESSGIYFALQLSRLSVEDIKAMPQLGDKAVGEIREVQRRLKDAWR